jgi:hypothetical protein
MSDDSDTSDRSDALVLFGATEAERSGADPCDGWVARARRWK